MILWPCAVHAQTADAPVAIPRLAGGTYAYGSYITDDGSIVVGYGDNAAGENNAFIWTAAGGMANLGTLSAFQHGPAGMSSDGSIIVGDAIIPGGSLSWIWTAGSGIVDLGNLGGIASNGARGVSDDGTVVTGFSNDGVNERAFRWTSGGGMVDLGTLGGSTSSAHAISGDGSTIVGEAYITGDTEAHAFRWTSGGGMTDIGTLGGDARAVFVSDDGNAVFGFSWTGLGDIHPFRWTSGSGIVDLGTLGGSIASIEAISENGDVGVGGSLLAGDTIIRAIRWTQTTGMTDLGSLGGSESSAYTVSSDGNIVYGIGNLPGDIIYHGFRWTEADGLQDINTLMSNAGVDMTSIEIVVVNKTSSDGQYFTGGADFGSGIAAFIARYTDSTAGLTTGAAQAEATEDLAATQQRTLIGTRSASNILLGNVQPIRSVNTTSSGVMFGSAMGYTNAEYSRENVTVFGGIGYGHQEYEGAELHDAPVFAGAARYNFGDVNQKGIVPYVEGGGSVSPFQDVTFFRPYANGAGTATGKGTTGTIQGLWYGRAGLAWNLTQTDQITGYGEFGQQYLSFDSYTENLTASNPFPARIESGTSRMNVLRAGGSWSHEINDTYKMTISGALARSYNVDPDLVATVSGIGTMQAQGEQFTWGEYGVKLEAGLTDAISLNFIMNGTKGGSGIGNATHGGISLSYKF